MSLAFTGELCVMKMKNDSKFEEEFTCQWKMDIKNQGVSQKIKTDDVVFKLEN